MKKSIILAAALLCGTAAFAQQKAETPKVDLQFTTVIENPITSVKNQFRSGTCWAYSTIGFVESEIIRINGIKDPAQYPDLAEMFIVSKSYQDRADKYVRLDGHLTFAAGSEADDVLDVIRDYGIVPQSAMPGLNYGTDKPVHGELDALARAYVEQIVKNPNKGLSTAWKAGFKGIMDAYLGECPETFEQDGKSYTPASYRDALKFNPDDYVTLTSFTHHPFYTEFAIEICDNWRWDMAYNVPIDELMAALDNALENGYTAAWGADVSERGFTRDGIGLLLDNNAKPTAGSDQEHWLGKGEDAQKAEPQAPAERATNQESRQADFDSKATTDDHGMQIYGIAKDQFGKKYYMVKNSWGETGKYKGIWYVSEAYVRHQTMDIVLHKDALPKASKKNLNIK